MPTALITGVSGQDGSYLAEQLLARGYRVVGLHRRLSASNLWRVRHLDALELRCADLLDLTSLLSVMASVKPDEVYHLGAQSFVPTSWEQPLLTAEVTGLGTLRVLEAVRHGWPEARVYVASSSEMFGPTAQGLLDESAPMRPRSPYAVAKLFAHHLGVAYREGHGLFVSCGICFNHESPRRAESFVTRKVAMGVARIRRAGGELALGSLAPRRDWGWAPDTTRAMQAILLHDEPDDFVVATGVSHSVQELVEAAFAVAGLDWRDHVVTDPALVRINELPGLRGDATKAREVLGWAPTVDFAGLVERMVEAELGAVR